ncbi:hypothetical protein B7486_03885, partial [cyanobacterium TDX16]
MLKRNGRGVFGGGLVVAVAIVATSSVGVASVMSSYQAMWARVAHDSVLAGCDVDPNANQCTKNENDDPPKPCPPGDLSSHGIALHVDITNGNVTTEVPILTAFGAGEESLSLSLHYNSLLSNEDIGLGYGWSLSNEARFEDAHPIHWSAVCVDDDGEGHCIHWECNLDKPGDVVLIDGDGRRNAFSRQYTYDLSCPDPPDPTGYFYSPPARDAILVVAALANDCQAGVDDFRCVEAGEVYRLSYFDGRVWFYGQNKKISRMVSARGLTTRFEYYPDARIQRIIDGYGRIVEFVWDASADHIERIIHPDSTPSNPVETVFTYATPTGGATNSLLESITDPESKTVTYAYADAISGYYRITQETLKNGTVFECEYGADSRSRIISARRPGDASDTPVLSLVSNGVNFPLKREVNMGSGSVLYTDELGTDWTYHRDQHSSCGSWGQMASIVPFDNYVGPYYTSTYDYYNCESTLSANRRLKEEITPTGLHKLYTWGDYGRMLTLKLAFGSAGQETEYTTIYGYVPHDSRFPGLPKSMIQPDGGQWTYAYNDYADLTTITDPDGKIQSINYVYFPSNANLPAGIASLPGRVSSVTLTDRNGNDTIWAYNTKGDLVSKQVEVHSAPQQTFILTEYASDAMGRRTREIAHRGDGTQSVMAYEYDAMGRMTAMVESFVEGGPATNEQNLRTEYEFDGHGLLVSETNSRGIVTAYVYDALHRVHQVIEDAGTDPENLNLTTTYDWRVQLSWYSFAESQATLRVTDPKQRVTEYLFDAERNVFALRDAEGYDTRYDRDPSGRVTAIRRQTLLCNGQPCSSLIPQNAAYTFLAQYDQLGRLASYTLNGNPQIKYEYDHPTSTPGCSCGGFGSSIPKHIYDVPSGNTLPRALYTEIDKLGRLRKVIRKVGGDDGSDVDSNDIVFSYDYDDEGNLTQITGPDGETTILTYDGADRLVSRTQSASPFDPLTTTVNYDGVNNVRSVTLPNGHVLNYDYDAADRLKKVYDSLGDITEVTLDAGGNVLTRADGNGNTWTYEYDPLDRVKRMLDPIVETPDQVITQEYDDVGNLIKKTNRRGMVTKYDYDNLDRLIRVTEDFMQTGGGGQQALDGSSQSGVQGQGVLQGGTYAAGGGGGGIQVGNEQTSEPTTNTITAYVYNGRHLIQVWDRVPNTSPSGNSGNKTVYEYDVSGRLLTVQYPDYTNNCAGQTAGDECNGVAGWAKSFNYTGTLQRFFVRRDQRQVDTKFTFDELGRLIEKEYTPISTTAPRVPRRKETFAYDKSGRLTTAASYEDIDGDGAIGGNELVTFWTRDHDDLGRPTQEAQHFEDDTQPVGFYVTELAYLLDPIGHTLTQQMCYPGCETQIVERTWDARGRVASTGMGAGIGVDWTFDGGDRRTIASRRHANVNISTLSYDENDRITGIMHFTGLFPPPPGILGPSLAQNFAYDSEGNRLYMDNLAIPDRSETYGHDNRHRLTQMKRGLLSTDAGGAVTVATEDVLSDANITGMQQWVKLDTRGNWLDFREAREGETRKESRRRNGANEYIAIDPDGNTAIEGGPLTDQLVAHDRAGNLTFDPLAKVAGSTGSECGTGIPPCGPGQEYAYDAEQRVWAIYRDTNDGAGPYFTSGPKIGQINEPLVTEFVYDALGRRVETIDYVDAATGATLSTPKRTRHVYLGLETIQEYECDPEGYACETGYVKSREFVWGDP